MTYFSVSAAWVFGVGMGFLFMSLMQPTPKWFGAMMAAALTVFAFFWVQYGPAFMLDPTP